MTVQILHGDCRKVLKTLPAESVHCVVTSPPYWGLRDYGVEPSVWGGDAGCSHDWEEQIWYTEQSAGKSGAEAFSEPGAENAERLKTARWRRAATCKACGAWRGAFGLEPTPELYVAHAVEIFREVHRVLHPEGTLWLNLGDSYARDARKGQHKPGDCGKQAYVYDSGGGRASACVDLQSEARGSSDGEVGRGDRAPIRNGATGLKAKDLIGIPWMTAFALRSDGWYLRQDIIWSKPNPMPESVTDRCTKAHEYLFLLSKSERYFYDADAIREAATYDPDYTKMPDGWDTGPGGHGSFHRNGREKGAKSGNKARKPASARGVPIDTNGETNGAVAGSVPWEGVTRNKRSVWTIGTAPFPEAHFATFPPALIEPCILAGCPEGGIVLDPFGGAGTTGLVADRLKRNAILIELNPDYADMARRRIIDDAPLFANVTDGYDAEDDFAKSIEFAYDHIRARKANGGKGWRE